MQPSIVEGTLDQWDSGHRIWSRLSLLLSCMNLGQSLDPRSQNARHGSKHLVQPPHVMNESGPRERKRLTQSPQGVNAQARISQYLLSWLLAQSSFYHYFGDQNPAKCSQLCWRPEDFGVGRQMVPNKLSWGCGHPRSSSQCILICHGWYKCWKHSDAFKKLLGECHCTFGGPRKTHSRPTGQTWAGSYGPVA